MARHPKLDALAPYLPITEADYTKTPSLELIEQAQELYISCFLHLDEISKITKVHPHTLIQLAKKHKWQELQTLKQRQTELYNGRSMRDYIKDEICNLIDRSTLRFVYDISKAPKLTHKDIQSLKTAKEILTSADPKRVTMDVTLKGKAPEQLTNEELDQFLLEAGISSIDTTEDNSN